MVEQALNEGRGLSGLFWFLASYVQQTDGPNYHAFGTFGTSPVEQALVPKAGGSRSSGTFAEFMSSSTPGSSEEPTILIHGNPWKIRDIADIVSERIQQNWHREKWHATPALIHRTGGVSSQYRGKTFDSTKIDLVPGGWNHDHCVVCWWTLHETDNEEEGIGYRNDSDEWLCTFNVTSSS